MGKSQLLQKNEELRNLKVIRLSNSGKNSNVINDSYIFVSNKPQTIITELIAILLIINKLKFNLLLIIIRFN